MDVLNVTAEEIEGWKREHKKVQKITVSFEGEKKQFIIARPTREVVNAMQKYDRENNIEKQQDILVKNCIKAGDTSLLKDIDVFNTVIKRVNDLVEDLTTEVEEL